MRLPGNADYELATEEVSFPYARPEVKTFVERLSEQYRAACGERLVVTSLTRPITRQPPNASVISVHPTGMAADLRRSDSPGCRQWLETVLLDLEGKGVIEATREQYPPHYHVAVFPNPYLQYLASGEALPEIQVARSTPRERHAVPDRPGVVAARPEGPWPDRRRRGESPPRGPRRRPREVVARLACRSRGQPSPGDPAPPRGGRARQVQERRAPLAVGAYAVKPPPHHRFL